MTADQNVSIRNFQENTHPNRLPEDVAQKKMLTNRFLVSLPPGLISAGTYWSVWGKQRNLWSLIELVVVKLKRDFTHGVAAIKGIWVLRHNVTANSMKLTACNLIFLSLKSQTFSFFLFLPHRSVLFCFDGSLSGISFHLAVAALCPVSADKSCFKNMIRECWTNFSFDWGSLGGVTERHDWSTHDKQFVLNNMQNANIALKFFPESEGTLFKAIPRSFLWTCHYSWECFIHCLTWRMTNRVYYKKASNFFFFFLPNQKSRKRLYFS